MCIRSKTGEIVCARINKQLDFTHNFYIAIFSFVYDKFIGNKSYPLIIQYEFNIYIYT